MEPFGYTRANATRLGHQDEAAPVAGSGAEAPANPLAGLGQTNAG